MDHYQVQGHLRQIHPVHNWIAGQKPSGKGAQRGGCLRKLLHAAGCSIFQIAAVLGHRKPDMTLTYADEAQGKRVEASEKLSELLNFSV